METDTNLITDENTALINPISIPPPPPIENTVPNFEDLGDRKEGNFVENTPELPKLDKQNIGISRSESEKKLPIKVDELEDFKEKKEEEKSFTKGEDSINSEENQEKNLREKYKLKQKKYQEDTISLDDSGLISDASSRYKSPKLQESSPKKFFKRIENFSLIRFKNNDLYCGTHLNNLKDGLGYLRIQNSGIYEGEFMENFYEGIGYMALSNTHAYLGEFQAGTRHGIGKNIQGEIEYLGEHYNGRMEGAGQILNLNGASHTGYFVNGFLQGYGEIIEKSRDYKFRGFFDQGKRTKNGIEKSGFTSYYGGFKNGKRDSIGCIYQRKKLVYLGEFEDGEKTGFCHLVLDKDHCYDGVLYKGERHGIGRMSNKQHNVCYTGQYRYDKRHGFGRLETGKDIYVGNWAKNRKNGLGFFKRYNGESYYGFWRDGKREGIGYETYEKREYKGEFRDDLYHGRAIVKAPGREQVYAYFEKGRLIELISEDECKFLMKTKLDIENFFSKSKKKLIDFDFFIQDSKKLIVFNTQHLKNQIDELGYELKDDLSLVKGEFQVIRDKFDLISFRIDDMKSRAGLPISERELDRMWVYDEEEIKKFEDESLERKKRVRMFEQSLLSKGITSEETFLHENSDRMMLDPDRGLTQRATTGAAFDKKLSLGVKDRASFLNRWDYQSGAFGGKILDSGGIRYVSQYDDSKFLDFANKRLEEVVS